MIESESGPRPPWVPEMVAIPVFFTARELGRMIIGGLVALLFILAIPGLRGFLGGLPIIYGYPTGFVIFIGVCYWGVTFADDYLFG